MFKRFNKTDAAKKPAGIAAPSLAPSASAKPSQDKAPTAKAAAAPVAQPVAAAAKTQSKISFTIGSYNPLMTGNNTNTQN